MRIKLILPALKERRDAAFRPIKYSLFPPLSLMTIAALTPPGHEITIEDEHVEEINLEDDADIVGITVYISSAERAYELADWFRKRGSKVVMGGIHPTTMPQEALQHADSVVMGAAEKTWPQVIRDVERDCLKPYYADSRQGGCLSVPAARRDLMQAGAYLVHNTMIVSRGCPNRCEFCYNQSFNGHSFQLRPLAEVVRELQGFKSSHVFFLDDNFLSSRSYVMRLLPHLEDQGLIWQCAGSIDIAEDPEYLRLLRRAGCRSIFIGFESLSRASLREAHKTRNLRCNYARGIRRIHEAGIMINASFVFGFDHDDPGIFERTLEFACRNSLETCTFHILTPYPGTALFKRLLREGRILHRDWPKYDTRHVVFRPRGMTVRQLQDGYDWIQKECYTMHNILRRSRGASPNFLRRFFLNIGWKKCDALWKQLVRFNLVGAALPLLERTLGRNKSKKETHAGSPSTDRSDEAEPPGGEVASAHETEEVLSSNAD